ACDRLAWSLSRCSASERPWGNRMSILRNATSSWLGAAVAVGSMAAAGPAWADLVLPLHNDTGETAKLVVQNIGVVQVETGRSFEFRMAGNWFVPGAVCFMGIGCEKVPTALVANVEHLAGP